MWSVGSKRTGLIGVKRGMSFIYNELNQKVPVTLIEIEKNRVNQLKKPSSTNEHHFLQLQSRNQLKEFPVTENATIPINTELNVSHFIPGQFVDIQGTSNGKGFAGVMKRWNFKGLRASHGTSISHRSQGSTGQNQDPGRVFPGKKMAGRMGGETTTVQNLKVIRIDTINNLLLVKGAIPGRDNNLVYIKDAVKKMLIDTKNKARKFGYTAQQALPYGVDDLPMPTISQEMAKSLPAVLQAPAKPQKD